MTDLKNLMTALLQAQSNIQGVAKDSRNEFHRYSYASADDMIAACREALHAASLTVHRATWWLSADDAGQPRALGASRRTDSKTGEIIEDISYMLCCEFVLCHGASGESLREKIYWPVVPEKGRPLDKAMAGALTSSFGYWLRDLLALPRGDHEMDRRDDRASEPVPARRPLQPQPAPAAPSTAPDEADLMSRHMRLCANAVKGKVPGVSDDIAERAVLAALKANGGHVAMLASAAGYGEAVKVLKKVKDWQAVVDGFQPTEVAP